MIIRMHRSPWYRSLVFQLALPVLLFLPWAWHDSGTCASRVSFIGREHVFVMRQYLGGVELSHWQHPAYTSFQIGTNREKYDPVRHDMYPYVRGFVIPPHAIKVFERSAGEEGIRIAHGLIFGVFLMLLLMYMLWRNRRNSRQ